MKTTNSHPEPEGRGIYLTILLFSILILNFSVFAENSLTLPAGRFRARIKPIYAFDFKTQLGNAGTEESLVSQFEKELDANLAEKISPQVAFMMRKNGIATLGKFDPSLTVSSFVFGSAVEYGLTDELTVGAIIPFVAANTRFNVQFQKTPFVASTPTLNAINFEEKVKSLATANGYDYRENWENFGLGDIELGFKYRWLNNDWVTLATKAGVRLPTGKPDNPDQLIDVALGDGQTDLGATLLVDFKGLPSTLLTAMTKYTLQLPDRQLLRVPNDQELFTSKKENIYRNLGDRVDTSLTAEVALWKVFNINTTYAFFSKEKDRFQSNAGYYDKGLEKNTAQSKHTADVGIGFSTLPWFKEGSFSFPMDAGINVEIPLAGRNVANVRTVNLEYKLYF